MFNPSELSLAALPSVALESRCDLPMCQGVYFAVAHDGTVLYIGKAINIRKRWMGHHRKADIERWGDVSIFWLQFDGSAELLHEIEQACVKHFDPLLNKPFLGKPKREGATKRTYMLSDELINRLTAIAITEGRTVTAQMERFLWEKIREYEKTAVEKEPGQMRRTVLAAARL